MAPTQQYFDLPQLFACQLILSGITDLEGLCSNGNGWGEPVEDDITNPDLYRSFFTKGIFDLRNAFLLKLTDQDLTKIQQQGYALMDALDTQQRLVSSLTPEERTKLNARLLAGESIGNLVAEYKISYGSLYALRNALRKKPTPTLVQPREESVDIPTETKPALKGKALEHAKKTYVPKLKPGQTWTPAGPDAPPEMVGFTTEETLTEGPTIEEINAALKVLARAYLAI